MEDVKNSGTSTRERAIVLSDHHRRMAFSYLTWNDSSHQFNCLSLLEF